jgi:hypothetical protein
MVAYHAGRMGEQQFGYPRIATSHRLRGPRASKNGLILELTFKKELL